MVGGPTKGDKPRIPALTRNEIEAASRDPNALSEADAIDKEETYDQKQAARKDQFHGAFHKVAVCGVYFLGLLGGFLVLAYVSHLMLPERWHWIDGPTLEKIQALLVGAGAVAVARVFQHYQVGK